MDETEASLEGFLCPVCRFNFRTDGQLLAHYQDKHSDDFFKSVKEIYVRAKKKILFRDLINSNIDQEEIVTKSIPGYCRSEVSDEMGLVKKHTEFFKTIRSKKMEHYASQTNNLIIRLEKLLLNMPSDPVKRKVHEKDVVPWLDEKDVKLCPGCAKSFNLLRRKHHCRLCGSIMCNECTFVLQLETARKMTNSLITTSAPGTRAGDSGNSNSSFQESKSPKNKLLRSPSGASVQSVLSLDLTGETFFRLCEHCYKLLEMRQKLKEVRNQKPIVCEFYEKLRANVDEINRQLPIYMKMFKSLSMGETTYNLPEAELIRVKILRAADNVDVLRNKIAVLGQNSGNPPEGNHLIVQKAIQSAATHYLKVKIDSLPSLPDEDQIKEAQERRRMEIARRIEEENRLESLETGDAEAKSLNKSSANNSAKFQANPSSSTAAKEVFVDDGWTPVITQSAVGIISDHPIIQQINIIKGYIKQAESARRSEEVAMLQTNLRDLEEEFWRQTKESNSESR